MSNSFIMNEQKIFFLARIGSLRYKRNFGIGRTVSQFFCTGQKKSARIDILIGNLKKISA